MAEQISRHQVNLEKRCLEVRIAVNPAITASSKYWDGAQNELGVTIIGPWLDDITKLYWRERERIRSGTYDRLGKIIYSAQRQIDKAIDELRCVPLSFSNHTDQQAVHPSVSASAASLSELLAELHRRIAKLGDMVSGGSEAKGRNPLITETCLELLSAWEEYNGRKFHGTFDTTRSGDVDSLGRPRFEFLHPDALFVQLAVQAIDPHITDSQVRTGLRLAVKLSSTTYSVVQNRMNLVL